MEDLHELFAKVWFVADALGLGFQQVQDEFFYHCHEAYSPAITNCVARCAKPE